MARHRNRQWALLDSPTWDTVVQAVLMDIRDEMQSLNTNLVGLPCVVRLLTQIERQLRMQRRCPKHPRYTATRKPRVACSGCHRYYKAVWK